MTQAQAERFVVLTILAAMSGVAAASVVFALSLPDFGFGDSGPSAWYFRLRSIDLTTEMLVLGGVGYALTRLSLGALCLRVAAGFGVVAIVVEVAEIFAELDSPIAALGGSVGARTVAHLADLAAAAAVIAAWYFTERWAPRTVDA